MGQKLWVLSENKGCWCPPHSLREELLCKPLAKPYFSISKLPCEKQDLYMINLWYKNLSKVQTHSGNPTTVKYCPAISKHDSYDLQYLMQSLMIFKSTYHRVQPLSSRQACLVMHSIILLSCHGIDQCKISARLVYEFMRKSA